MLISFGSRRGCIAVAVLFCLGTICSGQTHYFMTSLGTSQSDGYGAFGINDYGQVIGSGFLWTPTTPNATTGSKIALSATPHAINEYGQVVGAGGFLFTPSMPNGTSGTTILIGSGVDRANGINSFGQITGTVAAAGLHKAFIWTPTVEHGSAGSLLVIGTQAGPNSGNAGDAVNDLGQVTVHMEWPSSGNTLLWRPPTSTEPAGSMLTLLGETGMTGHSPAKAVNRLGQIVGDADYGTGFLWTPATDVNSVPTAIPLGKLPGASGTSPEGMNDFAAVVGDYSGSENAAFIWTPETGILDLKSLVDGDMSGWRIRTAYDINNLGQIVASGWYNPDGPGPIPSIKHAILLTPVPEPIPVAVVGTALLVAMRRRHSIPNSPWISRAP